MSPRGRACRYAEVDLRHEHLGSCAECRTLHGSPSQRGLALRLRNCQGSAKCRVLRVHWRSLRRAARLGLVQSSQARLLPERGQARFARMVGGRVLRVALIADVTAPATLKGRKSAHALRTVVFVPQHVEEIFHAWSVHAAGTTVTRTCQVLRRVRTVGPAWLAAFLAASRLGGPSAVAEFMLEHGWGTSNLFERPRRAGGAQ